MESNATSGRRMSFRDDPRSSLLVIAVALAFLGITVVLDSRSLHLPGRPVGYLILVPVCVLPLAAWLGGGGAPGPSVAASREGFRRLWGRLLLASVATLGFSPFFVWQFRVYQNRYMLACGLLAVLALTAFLVCLLRVDQALFEHGGAHRILAEACQWLALALPPLTATVAVTVYAYAFRYGGRWVPMPVESPYSVWLRLPLWIRWMPIAPLAATCLLTLIAWMKIGNACHGEDLS